MSLLGRSKIVWALASKPGTKSPTVGMCGSASERVAVVTASARSLPALMYSRDEVMLSLGLVLKDCRSGGTGGDCMKFLLIDDHVLIREALRGVLKELRRDATVLEAATCRQAEQLGRGARRSRSYSAGLEFAGRRRLSRACPVARAPSRDFDRPLIGQRDRDNVVRALDLGAVGFIPKSAQRAVMVGALELVLSGGIYIPPEILVRARWRLRTLQRKNVAIDRLRFSPADCGLTERQVEVLALMTQGKSNKAIGRVLALAEPTVKNHVAAILKALKVKNRTEAAMAVVEYGWDLRRDEK